MRVLSLGNKDLGRRAGVGAVRLWPLPRAARFASGEGRAQTKARRHIETHGRVWSCDDWPRGRGLPVCHVLDLHGPRSSLVTIRCREWKSTVNCNACRVRSESPFEFRRSSPPPRPYQRLRTSRFIFLRFPFSVRGGAQNYVGPIHLHHTGNKRFSISAACSAPRVAKNMQVGQVGVGSGWL